MKHRLQHMLIAVLCLTLPGIIRWAAAQEANHPALTSQQCDLQQAIDSALKKNPELKAMECELRAAQARVSQASLWQNPAFTAESENFSGDKAGFNDSENTFSVNQPFLLGGKITFQKGLAEKERSIAEYNLRAKRIEIITEVEHAIYDIILFQQNVNFAQQNHINAEKLHDFIEGKKYQKGSKLQQHELLSAKIELSQAEIEIHDAEKKLEIAKRYLTTLWAEPELSLKKVTCELERTFQVPAYDALKDYVIKNNIEIKVVEEQKNKEDIALKLAKAERIPDMDVGFGVRQFAEDDTYAFVTGISFPLPLFDRNQGRIQEAIENITKAEAEKNVLINNLLMQLDECYRDYQYNLQLVNINKNSILPMAQDFFDLTLREYQKGALEYLEVLNAERKLTETKKIYAEALHALQVAIANLEKLCARTLHGENGEKF